jgi:hypothetical protein
MKGLKNELAWESAGELMFFIAPIDRIQLVLASSCRTTRPAIVFKRRAALRARAAPPLVRRPRCAARNFGTVRSKLCLNFTPWRLAIFTPPRTIFAANFVSVGKVIFF